MLHHVHTLMSCHLHCPSSLLGTRDSLGWHVPADTLADSFLFPRALQAPEATASGKRQGPLPLWVAEFAVLGLYAALAASVTKYSKESAAAIGAVGKLVKDLAKKANLV